MQFVIVATTYKMKNCSIVFHTLRVNQKYTIAAYTMQHLKRIIHTLEFEFYIYLKYTMHCIKGVVTYIHTFVRTIYVRKVRKVLFIVLFYFVYLCYFLFHGCNEFYMKAFALVLFSRSLMLFQFRSVQSLVIFCFFDLFAEMFKIRRSNFIFRDFFFAL